MPILKFIQIAILLLGAWHFILSPLKQSTQDYIYGYPLVVFEETKVYMNTTNKLLHKKDFPTPEMRAVVRPNVDTLYSLSFLDLSGEPIYMRMPDTKDRYYMTQVMDSWTNVIGSFGKRTTGTKEQEYLFTREDWKGNVSEGTYHVKCPTNDAWIIIRIQANGEDDLENVNKIQDQIVLKEYYSDVNSTGKDWPKNFSNRTNPDAKVAQMSTDEFFISFAEYLKSNVPSAEDSEIVENLKEIAVESGKDWDKNSLSFLKYNLLKIGTSLAKKIIYNGQALFAYLKPTVNGWSYRTKDLGKYGTQYLLRAIIAHIGLGANIPEDAVYCNTFSDEDNNDLVGTNNYVLHFEADELPPVNAFWSLTLYDEESFLVPNEINRYAIRDRDSLKFNDDGSLDIYIQSVKPESEKVSNWLPAAKGKFNLTLRLYWPKESVFDGSWKPRGIKSNN